MSSKEKRYNWKPTSSKFAQLQKTAFSKMKITEKSVAEEYSLTEKNKNSNGK